jgi:flagellar M-ring protein FliF
VNKAFAQISDLFRSMTPGARITAGLLLAVVVISVAYLFNSSVAGPDTFLLGGRAFSDKEMVRIQTSFGEAGLNNWEAVGSQIRVPRNQQAQYLAALAKGGALPQDFRQEFIAMVQEANPFTSDRQRQDTRALAEMNLMSQMIEALPNVDHANVMVKEDRVSGLGNRNRRTANVIVFPKAGYELTAEDAKSFRQIVVGAQNIDARQISVVDGSNNTVMATLGQESVGAGGNDLLLAKRAWERLYNEKTQEILSFVNGAVVRAEVQVKPEARSRSTNLEVDKKNTTASQTSERSSESTSQSGGPGGRPGFESNSPVPNGFASVNATMSAQQSTTDSTSDSQTSFITPFTETTREIAGFEAELVQVAVSVPESHFIDLWRKANPTPAGGTPTDPLPADLDAIATEEIKKIKAQVNGILPQPPAGSAITELVTVNRFSPPPVQEAPAASFLDSATGWLTQSWSTVAMFLLAGFGLMTLRGLTKSIPTVEPAPIAGATPALQIAPETTEDAPATDANGKPTAPGPRLKRRGVSGPSLREELSEIVKEDPDAAANVLRAWIGAGA